MPVRLAALLLRDNAASQAAVTKAQELLRAKAPPAPAAEREFKLLQVQLSLQRSDAAAALALLDSPALQPVSRSGMLLRTQAALMMWNAPAAAAGQSSCPRPGQAQALPAAPQAAASAPRDESCDATVAAYKELRASTEALQSWVSIHPSDPLAWGALAQAEEAGASACAPCARRPKRAPHWATSPAPSTGCAPRSAGSQRRRQRLHRSLGHRLAPAPARNHAPADRRRHARQVARALVPAG